MSGDRYYIDNQNSPYFLTFTVVDWMDIFTRKEHCFVIVDSLNYCVKNKGLRVYAWTLMSNHLHLIAQAEEGFKLSDIIRDFKKFTAKKIISQIKEEPESRREWLLNRMEYRGKDLKRITKYKFWEDSNHAIELIDNLIFEQKLNYVHNNPVEAMITDEADKYIWSSAKDFAGEKGLVKIFIE